jgi:hypothetical protein
MKVASLPAVPIEPEFIAELVGVLSETETIGSFIEQAVRGAVRYRRAQAVFQDRGQAAWQEYLQTGQSRSATEVFDQIQGRLDARRRGLASGGLSED